MAKRFTETTKWRDKWFLSLEPSYKLAWLFICDECDHAGIVEVVEPLANMQIGFQVDWDGFFEVCQYRTVKIEDGKWWVKAFCDFQYGTLNPDNRVHRSVLKRLDSMGLTRGLEAPSKALRTRTKTRTDKKKETVSVNDDWIFPDGWDCPELRTALDGFEAMRKKINKPIRSRESTSKVFKHFDDADHLIFAAETCEANQWQGLKPDYRPNRGGSGRGYASSAQQRVENSRKAIEDFCNDKSIT